MVADMIDSIVERGAGSVIPVSEIRCFTVVIDERSSAAAKACKLERFAVCNEAVGQFKLFVCKIKKRR